MTISFKEAKEQNINELLAMMEKFYAFFNYPFDKELTTLNLFKFIAERNLGRIWTIYEDNHLIGYVVLAFGFSFEYKGVDAFVDELYISESHRSKGIGKHVMAFIEEQARKEGIKTIHLEVEKDNIRGERLYLKEGFIDNHRKLLTKYLD